MSTFGFRKDQGNSELDIHVNGTIALTLSSTDISFPVSTITYGGRGTVAQDTSHAEPVTINASSGTITLHTTTLATAAEAVFRVTNSFVDVGDVVVVNVQTDNDASTPVVGIAEVGDGFFDIILINPHATETGFDGSTTLNFAVIKTAA